MGKKIIKASVWTCRSMWSLYNRAVTLVFAIFCVASGLFARTASTKAIIGQPVGKVLSKADSTIIGNIKLYLCTVSYPLYGTGYSPMFIPVDSVISDSSGLFNISLSETMISKPELAFVKIDSVINNYDPFEYVSAYFFDPQEISDTLILYMEPMIRVGVKQKTASGSTSLIKTIRGNTVSIKIGNWSADEKYSAKIVNVAGELMVSLAISRDGNITWNTEKSASGVYFLNVETKNGLLNTQITVK